MYYYVEVVCLILATMLASHEFHENVFYYSRFHCFFFLNGVNIFCRLQKYWCKLYMYIIRNHTIINALKFFHQ